MWLVQALLGGGGNGAIVEPAESMSAQPFEPEPELVLSRERRDSGRFSLRCRSRVGEDDEFQTPERGQTGGSSSQRSSGQYKLSGDRGGDFLSEEHPLFKVLQSGSPLIGSSLPQVGGAGARLSYFLRDDVSTGGAAGEQPTPLSDDNGRCGIFIDYVMREKQVLAQIVQRSQERKDVLERTGEEKKRLLEKYEEERKRAEKEKQDKLGAIEVLLGQESSAPVKLGDVDELLAYLQRHVSESERREYEEGLVVLKEACRELLRQIRILKCSFEAKEFSSSELGESLVNLFTDQQKQLAKRLEHGNDGALTKWALERLGKVKVPFVEKSLRQADAYKIFERGIPNDVAALPPGVADSLRQLLDKPNFPVFNALNAGVAIAKHVSSFNQGTDVEMARCIGAILKLAHSQDTPRDQQVKMSYSCATILFTAFRFMSNLPVPTQDLHSQILIQALHSRCDLCIPTLRDDVAPLQSFQAIIIFSTLVAYAGYVGPSSIISRVYWNGLSFNGISATRSRLPISVNDGWQWLVRSARMLSQNTERISSPSTSDDEKRKLVALCEKLCEAMRIFLHCAGHSLLVALSRESGILSIIDSLRQKSQLLIEQDVRTAQALRNLCQEIGPRWGGGLRLMEQEPKGLVLLLETSDVWQECKPEVLKQVKDRKTELRTFAAGTREKMCYDLIVDIDDNVTLLSLKDDVSARQVWINSFLLKYARSFEGDGWKNVLGGSRTLYTYCMSHLCDTFMKQFEGDNFNIKKSSAYINGIMGLCANSDMKKRLFSVYFKMHFYQARHLLIPVVEIGDLLELQPKDIERTRKFVGVFALLVCAQLRDSHVSGPFSRDDGWCWLANILNLWKRFEGKSQKLEDLLARCCREFLRPGGDADPEGFPLENLWFPVLRSDKFRPLVVALRELAQKRVKFLAQSNDRASEAPPRGLLELLLHHRIC